MVSQIRRALMGVLATIVAWASVGILDTSATEPKPSIVDLINKLKPDSLRKANGKWLQTWVDDPGFGDKGPAIVDISSGFASFIDKGTGAGTIEHEFAIYYPENGGAVLAHNYTNDMDTYRSELKFYQLRAGKLALIESPMPKLSCRELASDTTKNKFYANAGVAKLADDPVLPTYSLPRKGTSIMAYCDASQNRFNIEAPLGEQGNLSHDDKAAIIAAIDFPFKMEYAWNKKKGLFIVAKRQKQK